MTHVRIAADYSGWFELRVGNHPWITVIFSNHPSTSNVRLFFRTFRDWTAQAHIDLGDTA